MVFVVGNVSLCVLMFYFIFFFILLVSGCRLAYCVSDSVYLDFKKWPRPVPRAEEY